MELRPLEPVFLQRRGRISKGDSAAWELDAQEERTVIRKLVPEGRSPSSLSVWGDGLLMFVQVGRCLCKFCCLCRTDVTLDVAALLCKSKEMLVGLVNCVDYSSSLEDDQALGLSGSGRSERCLGRSVPMHIQLLAVPTDEWRLLHTIEAECSQANYSVISTYICYLVLQAGGCVHSGCCHDYK